MSHVEHLPVQIGQVKVGREGQSLNAILGSCIGVGFLLKHKGVYGLAHCLLPKSNAKSGQEEPPLSPAALRRKKKDKDGGGRHVDEAIKTLMERMELTPQDRRDLRVFLAGGANMTGKPNEAADNRIGSVNAQSARAAIKAARLFLIEEDLGGINGRRVVIDCNTGDYSINSIPRLGET